MAGALERMARMAAAQGMAGAGPGPAPENIEGIPPAEAGVPPMPEGMPPEEEGMMPGGDPEQALGAVEMALASLSPDAAAKGRMHIEALREILAGGEGEGEAPSDMEITPEGEEEIA